MTKSDAIEVIQANYQDRPKGTKSNMAENEKIAELCSHAWVYDHAEHNDTVYLRCIWCNMVRIEPCQMFSRGLKIRHYYRDDDV